MNAFSIFFLYIVKYSNVIHVISKCWLFSLLHTSQGWDRCVCCCVVTIVAGLLLTYVCDNTLSFYMTDEMQPWSIRKGADNTAFHVYFIFLGLLLNTPASHV